jgi:transposase
MERAPSTAAQHLGACVDEAVAEHFRARLSGGALSESDALEWSCLGFVDTRPLGPLAPDRRSQVPKTRPPYPPEFRREALRLMREEGRTPEQLERELGVSAQTLRNWRRQEAVDAGRAPGLTTDERARLRELERENRILREEREILKKAAGFFAAETMRPGGSR